jgi:hypothetical protein
VLMKDRNGNVIGFEKLNFRRDQHGPGIAVESAIA